jgi:N-methylhydantoinase B/oxoprolinase/acetone carboxylase alpha subunit
MLPPETIVTLDMPGGGGFGDPLSRDPARVAADVLAGYVSIEAAREEYAVVLAASLALDMDATEQLRRKRSQPAGPRTSGAD